MHVPEWCAAKSSTIRFHGLSKKFRHWFWITEEQRARKNIAAVKKKNSILHFPEVWQNLQKQESRSGAMAWEHLLQGQHFQEIPMLEHWADSEKKRCLQVIWWIPVWYRKDSDRQLLKPPQDKVHTDWAMKKEIRSDISNSDRERSYPLLMPAGIMR